MSNELTAVSDSFADGIPDVSHEEHKALQRMLNHVWRGVVAYRPAQELLPVVFDLEVCARTFFRNEEAHMACHDYAELPAHRSGHAQFVASIRELGNRLEANQSVALKLLRNLDDWLTRHIGIDDRRYADFLGDQQPNGGGKICSSPSLSCVPTPTLVVSCRHIPASIFEATAIQ